MAQPVRTCVVCRVRDEKLNLHRFIWDGKSYVLDEGQKRNGRGTYCCRNAKCTDKFLSQVQKWRKIFRK